ncbi:hypothetical protein ACPX19_12130 [Winogradskyella sp. HB-48]|uniref:hypothetical protein n=1 Tax=Winogradskyella sp. HB-48 TaxID=3416808 RepID=UPI003CF27688
MKKSLFVNKLSKLIFVFTELISCDSNNYKKESSQKSSKEIIIDSVRTIKEQKIISPKGNQILENSEKLYNLKWKNGYILESINISQCDNSNTGEIIHKFDKKIDSIIFTNDSFTISFKAIENCCSEFLCEAEIINNDTLNIIYNAYGSHCFCNCLFDMSFQFSYNNRLDDIEVAKTNIKSVVLNNYLSSKAKFEKLVNTN